MAIIGIADGHSWISIDYGRVTQATAEDVVVHGAVVDVHYRIVSFVILITTIGSLVAATEDVVDVHAVVGLGHVHRDGAADVAAGVVAAEDVLDGAFGNEETDIS